MSDRSRYSIIPIGSLHTGFALTIGGVVHASDPDMIRLAAWVDAVRAGASEYDAGFIAKAIAARPWPTHGELLAVYTPTGGPAPSSAVLRAAGRSTRSSASTISALKTFEPP